MGLGSERARHEYCLRVLVSLDAWWRFSGRVAVGSWLMLTVSMPDHLMKDAHATVPQLAKSIVFL